MPFLLAFPWRWIAVAGVLILCGVIYVEARHIGRLEHQVDAATDIANANAQIAAQERAWRQEADNAAELAAKRAERVRQMYLTQRREAIDARVEDDGLIAPILRRTLDRLPEPERSAEADRDPARDTPLSADVPERSHAAAR